MTLYKGFLKPKHIVNKRWLNASIILGTAYSFVLYTIFYFLREFFRLFASMISDNNLIVLTPKENFYYNLFYGSISAILGFYVFIKFIFENSINRRNKKIGFKQRQVLNEQGFFMWTFLSAFSRIIFVFGIFYFFMPFQYDLIFSKDFLYLLLLIPIVLFLNIWTKIVRLAGKKSYKWFFYSLLYLAGLSLIYANINFINYQKINEKIQSKNIMLAYDLDVPVSESYTKIIRRSLITDIYMVKDSLHQGFPNIFWGTQGAKVGLDEVSKYAYLEREKLHESQQSKLIANLHVDKKIRLKFVKELEFELRKGRVTNIQYSTGIKNSIYPSYYSPHKYCGIKLSLFPYYHEFEFFLDSAENLDFSKYTIQLPESRMYRNQAVKGYNRIAIKVTTKGIFLNGKLISVDKLQSITKKFIKKYSPNYVIIYEPNEEISYEEYIKYLDVICTSVDKLRNEMSKELYNHPFEQWYRGEEYDLIKAKYPRNILEWTLEELRLKELLNKSDSAKNSAITPLP